MESIRRRVGSFTIDWYTINERPDICLAIMSKVVVIRAEAMYDLGLIDYVAASPEFDLLDAGIRAPDYKIILETDDEGRIGVSFVRVKE